MYFKDYFGLGLKAAGIVAGLFGLMTIFARTMGGMFGDRAGRKWGLKGRVAILGVVLAGEGLALILFSRMAVLPVEMVTLVAFSMFVQMSEGATFSVVPFVNRKALGSVAGIVGAGGNAGAVAAGFLFRLEGLPWPQALLILGVIVACTASLTLLVRFSRAARGGGARRDGGAAAPGAAGSRSAGGVTMAPIDDTGGAAPAVQPPALAPFTAEQRRYLDELFAGAVRRRPPGQQDAAETAPSVHGVPVDELTREERIKHERNPLDIWDTMLANAALGRFPEPDDVFRYKFHGLFHTAPAQDEYMCRLRVPANQISSRQLRGLAALAAEYAGGYADHSSRGAGADNTATPPLASTRGSCVTCARKRARCTTTSCTAATCMGCRANSTWRSIAAAR